MKFFSVSIREDHLLHILVDILLRTMYSSSGHTKQPLKLFLDTLALLSSVYLTENPSFLRGLLRTPPTVVGKTNIKFSLYNNHRNRKKRKKTRVLTGPRY